MHTLSLKRITFKFYCVNYFFPFLDMQTCVGKGHENNCVGSEVIWSEQSAINTQLPPTDMWLLDFLKMFPEMTDILYLYILDQKVWYLLLLHILKFSLGIDVS